MTTFERVRYNLLLALERASVRFLEILPEAALAFIVLVIGLVLASIVHFLTVRLVKFLAVDKLAAKTPLHRMLRSVGIHKGPGEIFALLLFWLTVLLTLIYASEILHLRQVSEGLVMVTRFVPQIIFAFLILVLGALLAKFLQSFAVRTVTRMGTGHEQSVGTAVQALVLLFVFLAAFQQIGLDLSFITTNAMIALAAMFVVTGIGLIVGAKTILENALSCAQLRRHVQIGQSVEIEGHVGVIEGFTLTSVLLREECGRVVLPASTFFRCSYLLRA